LANHPKGASGAKGGTEEVDPNEGTVSETLSSSAISTKLERIAKLARQSPTMVGVLRQRVRDGVF